jgi:short-subunit dehydrogenase
MYSFTNQVVWITGASSGIGEALVYELSRRNATLILSARRPGKLERVRQSCPPESHSRIFILPLDLSDSTSLPQAVQQAIQLQGHVDILINNAGLGQRSLILETSPESDRLIMEINYFGTVNLTKYLLPHFISRKKGHFVTISSLTGKFGTPYRSAYAASKHALHGFFDALRAEHWKDNILATMICPGFIDTNLRSSAVHGQDIKETDGRSYSRKSAEWCAVKIIRAIQNKKEEIYIGGKEVLAVYIKRFFPSIFSRIIRKVPVR